ncbi:hypothetical protein BGX38DRAFT_591117 [Terfezia claveryi]|nr:hypothetical protein BGX38DRAFT_591117 [Terfezia claveryi]
MNSTILRCFMCFLLCVMGNKDLLYRLHPHNYHHQKHHSNHHTITVGIIVQARLKITYRNSTKTNFPITDTIANTITIRIKAASTISEFYLYYM